MVTENESQYPLKLPSITRNGNNSTSMLDATERPPLEPLRSSQPVAMPMASRLKRYWLRLPAWIQLPLGCLITVCVLLVFILPVYTTFRKDNKEQLEPLSWPSGYSDINAIGLLDQFTIVLTLTGLVPDSRALSFLGGILAGGKYYELTSSGTLNMEGASLSLSIAGLGYTFDSGNAMSVQDGKILLTDAVPLYDYPFDKYVVNTTLSVSFVNETSPNQLQVIPVDTGLFLLKGLNGWRASCSVAAEVDPSTGDPTRELQLQLSFERSQAVRFFSIFVVLLMWGISLCVFIIALNFFLSPSNELIYDVATMCVGLLFALPFVREVQPGVPEVGITIDVFGYFWNILLVAASAALTLSALYIRHHRGKAAAEAKAAAARMAP